MKEGEGSREGQVAALAHGTIAPSVIGVGMMARITKWEAWPSSLTDQLVLVSFFFFCPGLPAF